MENEIPSAFLVPCEWPEQMKANQDTPEDHLYIDKTNIDRHKECYLRHNGLIDILKNRDSGNVKR